MVKVKELIDLYNKGLNYKVDVEINGDSHSGRNIEKYYDLEVSTFTVESYDGDDTLYIYVDPEQKWQIDDPLSVFN